MVKAIARYIKVDKNKKCILLEAKILNAKNGVSPGIRIKELFEKARKLAKKKNSYVVVNLEEIDEILKAGDKQLKDAILTELSPVNTDDNKYIIFVATTNDKDAVLSVRTKESLSKVAQIGELFYGKDVAEELNAKMREGFSHGGNAATKKLRKQKNETNSRKDQSIQRRLKLHEVNLPHQYCIENMLLKDSDADPRLPLGE